MSRDMLPGINLETPNKRAKEFRAIKQRPNVHIGLHYPRLAEEYGVPNNCNVLAGENKHRYLDIQVHYLNFQAALVPWSFANREIVF